MEKGYHALDIDFEIRRSLSRTVRRIQRPGAEGIKKIPEQLLRYVKLILHG